MTNKQHTNNTKQKEAIMANEIMTVNRSDALAVSLALHSVQDVRSFAADIAASGIIGQVTQTQAEVSLVAMRDEGLSMVEFKRKYQWVGQELTIRPNWLLGEFKRRGGKYAINRADREVCDMTFTSPDGDIVYNCAITFEEMKANGVAMGKNGIKDNWRKFPDDMLFARVCGKALRRVAPDMMGGVYTDGEAMDFDRRPTEAAGAVSASPIAEDAANAGTQVAQAASEAVDYGVCPCGSVKGKRWEDVPSETLEKILATPAGKAKALTADHRNAIVAELGRREAAQQDDAIEPEVVD